MHRVSPLTILTALALFVSACSAPAAAPTSAPASAPTSAPAAAPTTAPAAAPTSAKLPRLFLWRSAHRQYGPWSAG